MKSSKELNALIDKATAAAVAAAAATPDSAYCGFGWVEVNPGTSPLVKAMKARNIGNKHWKKGWCVWSPAKAVSQSMDVNYAGAAAYAKVLCDAGFNAFACQRAD